MPFNELPRLREPEKRDFVHEVRDLFLEEYKKEPELYYEEDVQLVKDLKFLLQRCIISKRKNVKDSLNMLVTMLKWRKQIRLRELTDQDFPIEYFTCGIAFIYEKDKFGNKTLFFRTSLLKVIPEMRAGFKEFVAYLLYKIDDCVNGESWAVVTDLSNTGWSNCDLDLLMHFLTLLKDYFPVNVDYILAVNFPWILSTVWTLVKRLIPPERRDVVVFIQDSEVFKFIDKEHVPDFLGGECKRDHKFSPKTCRTIVDYLLSQKDPELPAKRIKEIVKTLAHLLPDEHVPILFKQLENSGRP